MSTSDVKLRIVNRAMLALEPPIISNLNEASKSARSADLMFDDAFDETLRMHKWNWATVRTTLPKDAATPAFGYSAQFELPPDCVRLLGLQDPTLDYRLEGRKILCNGTAPLGVLYITNAKSLGEADAFFKTVLAYTLAIYLAPTLTGKVSKADELVKLRQLMLADGQWTDATETPDDPVRNEDFFDAGDLITQTDRDDFSVK